MGKINQMASIAANILNQPTAMANNIYGQPTTISPNQPVVWDVGTVGVCDGTISLGSPYTLPTAYTYTPPEEFQQQVVELIQLLHIYGPKLRLLADVLGAMNIEEEDKNNAK